MADKTLDLTIRIAGQMDKTLTAAINGTQSRLTSLTQTVSRIGTVGLAAMGAFAAGTVTALVKCTDAAGEFENQMSDVVKYVSGLADSYGQISDTAWDINAGGNGKTYAENYAEMTDAILDLSTQIPMTAEELTQLAAAAGQSGKSITDLIQRDASGNISGFLRDVAMMGTAMDISAEQAGDWAAKWEVAFAIDHSDVMTLADQINYLGAHNATTAAEIAQVVNAAAGLGQVAGMDVSATAALSTAMLAMGVNTEQSANAISRMYVNLSKGTSATKAQKTQWEALGLTAEGVAKAMQEDAAGTITDVFERIQALDTDKQVAALSTLFGQWAIKGAAKLTGNLDAFTNALEMVNDPSLYAGSMEREFIIKASTSGALDTMVQNTFQALKIDVGEAFLPAKKEVALSVIDFVNQLRDMPELGQIAQQIATLFSQGVTWAGNALQTALPYIQTALDYLINNGPQVVSTLGKIAAALAAMKFAPGITSVLGGVGSLIFGSTAGAGAAGAAGAATRTGGLVGLMSGLFRGGQSAAGAAAGLGGGLLAAGRSGGLLAAGGAMLSSLISGNGIGATTQLLQMAAGLNGGAGGALSGFQGIGSALLSRVGGTGIGQYLGNVGAAVGNFLNTSGIWPGLKATGGVAWEVLKSIAGPGNELGQGLNLTGAWESIRNAGAGAASWIGGRASAITQSRPVQAVTGFVGNVVNSAPVKAIAGWAGGTLTSGAQLLGTAAGPMLSGLLSGLGGIVAGAAPAVLAISGIIAVLSLLWDNVDMLRGPIAAVFGEQGLAVFDNFKDRLGGIFGFIDGLFKGGLADALSGVRGMFAGALEGGGLLSTIFGGTEHGLAAFDAAVSALQSVLGFVGQIVDFANGTVKPAIMEIFAFVTGTVMPTLIGIFTESAPAISSAITGVGNIVMTVVRGVMGVLQALWPTIRQSVGVVMEIAAVVIPVLLGAINLVLPVVEGIVSVIVPVVTVAVSTVGGLISGLAVSIGEIAAGIVRTFGGIIDFVSGVFTGNWEKAWNGVKNIFGGVFDALAGLCRVPMNAVIGIINGAIRGINGLGLTIPDWVPVLGGKDFRINIPEIQMLARGGFTNGPSIAGEAGTEAVISFQPGVRGQNIGTWMRAGEMLGVLNPLEDIGGAVRLQEVSAGAGAGGGVNITFAPNINIHGNADRQAVDAALADSEQRFETWIEQNFERLYDRMARQRSRTRYA